MVAEQMASRSNGDFGLAAPSSREASVEVASTRAAQEVQASMVIAKRFPRDETAAFQRVMQACKRKTLAECALYAYPKGGQTVTGPSIRLAEMLAQNWGNVDFGVIELEQRKGESTVMSYAWDLETNTRQTKIFTIKHERHTRNGSYALTDPRDIYELTANQGARRLRACILGVIPGDVVDSAVAECEKTMAGNNAEPLVDRIRSMVTAFAEMSVTQEMLEKRLGHKVEATTEAELVNLKKIYRSLRDNMADRSDFFEVGTATSTNLDERVAAAKSARQQKTTPAVDPDSQIPEDEQRAAEAHTEPPPPPDAENSKGPGSGEQPGDEGQQHDPNERAATLPDFARTDQRWIDDQITTHRPPTVPAPIARKKFHALHGATSWNKLAREVQDELYAAFLAGDMDWK